jgi:hypothetical protein
MIFNTLKENRDRQQQTLLEGRQHDLHKWREEISIIHSQVTLS